MFYYLYSTTFSETIEVDLETEDSDINWYFNEKGESNAIPQGKQWSKNHGKKISVKLENEDK